MKFLVLSALATAFLFSCNNKIKELDYNINADVEITQQIGESMAALDEVGGTASGDISKAIKADYERSFARMAPHEKVKKSFILASLISEASAASCSTVNFSACSTAFQKSRSISGCSTVAGGTISGVVLLTFSGTGAATCTMPAVGDGVVRTASIGVNGLRGAIFGVQNLFPSGQAVSNTGVATYTFKDTGTSRKFISPNAVTLLNLSTTTPTPLSFSGANRNTRSLTGGTVQILNNINQVSCSFTPTGVAWTAGCNCPTAGSFAATCSDSTSMNVAFTSVCGEVTLTKGTVTSTVILDRCE